MLEYRSGGMRRACLIDLGLSPRRTFRMLAEMGLGPHQIDDALLTHLDADHYNPSWARVFPRHARLRLHHKHHRAGGGLLPLDAVVPFDEPFVLASEIVVRPLSLAHDAAGVSAFRFEVPASLGGGSLGFATDLGRVTDALVDLFQDEDADGERRGVDVLAIESNYCPVMQEESGRPEFLKRRIMGGRGHLSNDEALDAIRRIRPREHVVLLHLSRQCNDPALVAGLHEGAGYALTITSQHAPTRPLAVNGAARTPRPLRPVVRTPSLFEGLRA